MSVYSELFIQNNQKTQFIGNSKNLQHKKLILLILPLLKYKKEAINRRKQKIDPSRPSHHNERLKMMKSLQRQVERRLLPINSGKLLSETIERCSQKRKNYEHVPLITPPEVS